MGLEPHEALPHPVCFSMCAVEWSVRLYILISVRKSVYLAAAHRLALSPGDAGSGSEKMPLFLVN